MSISNAMHKKLNEQVTHELGAAHNYLAMSLYFQDRGLKVLAKWFARQAEEEREHAQRIANYLQDSGAKVTLSTISKPESEYANVKSVVESALKAEQAVTKQIHALAALAEKEDDYATRSFLNWFIDEQVEEESTMTELLQWVELAGEKNLLQLENRLSLVMAEAS